MKYMTPELYARMQFARGKDAVPLYDEWEANGVRYRARYATFADRLPASLRAFFDGVCLHDAELRGFETDDASSTAPGAVVMNLRLQDRFVTLYYDLIEPPKRCAVDLDLTPEQHAAIWQTSGMPEWLYDEIDVLGDPADPAGFVHEILLSTGEIIRLVFFAFDWHVHIIGAEVAVPRP